jgi:hypothetical protein
MDEHRIDVVLHLRPFSKEPSSHQPQMQPMQLPGLFAAEDRFRDARF